MLAALIWLVAGVALIAAEVLSGEFVLLMLGTAALAAAGSAALFDNLLVDGLVFGLTAVLLLFAVRPVLRRRLDRGMEHSHTGIQALVGRHALVLARVDANGGQVKIGGDVWSARAYDHDQVLEPGTQVTVMDIAGATALVIDGG